MPFQFERGHIELIRFFIRIRGLDVGWIYTLGMEDGHTVLINELIPGDFIPFMEGNHDFHEITYEQYKKIFEALRDGHDPAVAIDKVIYEIRTEGVEYRFYDTSTDLRGA